MMPLYRLTKYQKTVGLSMWDMHACMLYFRFYCSWSGLMHFDVRTKKFRGKSNSCLREAWWGNLRTLWDWQEMWRHWTVSISLIKSTWMWQSDLCKLMELVTLYVVLTDLVGPREKRCCYTLKIIIANYCFLHSSDRKQENQHSVSRGATHIEWWYIKVHVIFQGQRPNIKVPSPTLTFFHDFWTSRDRYLRCCMSMYLIKLHLLNGDMF